VDTHAPKELSCLTDARLICLLALSLAHARTHTASMLLSRLTIVVALACIANLAHGIDLEIGGAPYLGTLTPSTPLEFAVCRSFARLCTHAHQHCSDQSLSFMLDRQQCLGAIRGSIQCCGSRRLRR